MESNTKLTAIKANLDILNVLLKDAVSQIEEATNYLADNEQNAAIGTITGLEQNLDRAKNLLGAALALHCS